MLKLRRFLIAGGVAVASFLAMVMPATAISAPSTTPLVQMANAYENWRETGDQIYFIRWNWTYGSSYPTGYPTETGRQSVIVRLMNGTTELANSAPITYFQYGWGMQMVAIYFTAADAPTWGSAYTVVVEGNPAMSWTASRPVSAAYDVVWQATPVDVATTDAEVGAYIPMWAFTLEQEWNATLTTPNNSVYYLNEYGDAYFSSIVPYLRAQCPNIFDASMVSATAPDNNKGTSYADTQRGGIIGTILDLTPLTDIIGLPMTLILAFLYSGLCLWGVWKMDVWLGTYKYTALLCVPLIIGGAVLGALYMIIPILMALAGGLMFIYSMWFEPAQM